MSSVEFARPIERRYVRHRRQIVDMIRYKQPTIVFQEPTLHGTDGFFLVLCIASWQGKHTCNLDESAVSAVSVSVRMKTRHCNRCGNGECTRCRLRLPNAPQSGAGGSPVPLELSVKLFENIFTSGEQPVAQGDVPVLRRVPGTSGFAALAVSRASLAPGNWGPVDGFRRPIGRPASNLSRAVVSSSFTISM